MSEDSDTRKERLLYLALAEFSDACDVPKLTPACPFYQLQPDGSPICGEECKDILSDELSHVVQPDTLTLGGDLAAVQGPRRSRPRPRRRPAEGQIAYDARQVYLTECDRDVKSWGMTSLIKGLQYQLAWMSIDPDDPPSLLRVNEICDELANRGVDSGIVIRQGLFAYVTSSILWHIRNALAKGADDLGWVALIREIAPDFEEIASDPDRGLEQALDVLRPYLTRWVVFAEIEDLMEHRVRMSVDELREYQLPDRDFDAVWLVERFTDTYLEDWGRRSLQREWRYIHSQCASPCPPANMRERTVELEPLAMLLAEVGASHVEALDRPSDADESEDLLNEGLLHVGQFFPIAVEALKRGDRAEAASIYQMLYDVRPDDQQVANNLGFCILPDEPERAAGYLEEAIEMTKAPSLLAMTYLNLALSHYVLGDIARAREALQNARSNPMDDFAGCMWDLASVVDGDWRLSDIHGALTVYADTLEELIDAAGP